LEALALLATETGSNQTGTFASLATDHQKPTKATSMTLMEMT